MVTKILLIIMLVLYVALLIMRYKKKDNPKIEGGVQVILCSIREMKQRKGVKAQKRNGWSRWQ